MNISANAGTIPGVPNIGGAASPIQGYAQPKNVFGDVLDWFRNVDTQMKNEGNILTQSQNFNYNQVQNRFGTGAANFGQNIANAVTGLLDPKSTATQAFRPPSNQPNTLVGRDVGSSPDYLTAAQVRQISGSMSGVDIQRLMESRGYMRSYEAGVGEVWVKATEGTGSPSSAYSGALDSRGRPEFVDPTALARGERVTDQSGVTYVGGAPYTDAGGTTVSQYAVTLPGGANDKKGAYKWTSYTKKDQNGNWVRVYQKKLRKVYSRSHRKKNASRVADTQQQGAVNANEVNQLVNLRADFG